MDPPQPQPDPDDHAEELDLELAEVAGDLDVPQEAVRLTALMVLEGYGDEEILEHFREITVSLNGQTNPMDRVVAMIAGVREVVSS